jgi:hypothetical protein
MTEPRRLRGVWVDEFEGSVFLPRRTNLIGVGGDEDEIWLDVETNEIPGLVDQAGYTRAFEIDFVGRQTVVPGGHGHMGGFDHHLIVDRVISVRPIDVTPWEQARQEYIRQFEQSLNQQKQ